MSCAFHYSIRLRFEYTLLERKFRQWKGVFPPRRASQVYFVWSAKRMLRNGVRRRSDMGGWRMRVRAYEGTKGGVGPQNDTHRSVHCTGNQFAQAHTCKRTVFTVIKSNASFGIPVYTLNSTELVCKNYVCA